MNLGELKLGEVLRFIQALQSGSVGEPVPGQTNSIAQRYIGKKVITRSYSAGNHFGELVAYDTAHNTVVLKNCRRLWGWKTKKGISLSEIALYGVNEEESQICETVPEQIVAEIDEVIPATHQCISSIEGASNA